MGVEKREDVRFLSELYAEEGTDNVLLAEYPSSNSNETRFKNSSRFIIHDPFPPPRPELMKVLGPHHLMCGWGNRVAVSSEVRPPAELTEHWERAFGKDAVPRWQAFAFPDESARTDDVSERSVRYHTLFPHESFPAAWQVVDPAVNYAIHSKSVIAKIDCPQADVLNAVTMPCLVKLSHGYAGLGNFFVRNEAEEQSMRQQVDYHWPDAELIINSIIENICGDFGVQFFLAGDGSAVWLGFTQQHFNENLKWCGGSFSAELQDQLLADVEPMIEATAQHLHECGYVGLVGIDILRNAAGDHFLVDVNPRLTGISPFLMNSRIFARQGSTHGIYRASVRTSGSIQRLIENAEQIDDGQVIVLSVFEEADGRNCVSHLSANADCLSRCHELLDNIAEC